MRDINVEKAKIISLEPNDIVVLEIDRDLTMQEMDNAHVSLKRLFPNNKSVIVPKGSSIKVVREMSNQYLKDKDRGEVT
jgi:hypothetical protein